MKKLLMGILVICMGFILYGCSKEIEVKDTATNSNIIDEKINYKATEVFEEATIGSCEMDIDNLNLKEGYYMFHGRKEGSNLNVIRDNSDFINQEVTNVNALILHLKKGDIVKMKNVNFSVLEEIK